MTVWPQSFQTRKSLSSGSKRSPKLRFNETIIATAPMNQSEDEVILLYRPGSGLAVLPFSLTYFFLFLNLRNHMM